MSSTTPVMNKPNAMKPSASPLVSSGNDSRKKELEMTLAAINKQYGDGSIMKMGEHKRMQVSVVSTGSISIDLALGVNGLPRGRIVEIYGPESSGKTTLCLSLIAQIQKQGGTAAFIDVEHALDSSYAKVVGVDLDELMSAQPDSGEQALDIAEKLIRSGAVDIVVVDSVAALVSKAELDGQIGDATVGVQARLMSQAMRRLTAAINRTQCICVFTNQIREKIGVMFGSPETTSGGRALKYAASVRMDIRRIGMIKNSTGQVVGNRTRLKVVKNKVAPPFTECEFDIMYNEGISQSGSIIDLATEHDIIKKKGSWFSYKDSMIGQGRESAKRHLMDHPEVMEEMRRLILEKVQVRAGTVLGKSADLEN